VNLAYHMQVEEAVAGKTTNQEVQAAVAMLDAELAEDPERTSAREERRLAARRSPFAGIDPELFRLMNPGRAG
jgi:hypothetical protein